MALVSDDEGNLYAGGNFSVGGALAVARWNGTSWSALGSGMDSDVQTVALDGSGNLYAGGFFHLAGGVPARHVAVWDGTSWSALGSGVDTTPEAFATDGSGNLYAGADFGAAGGNPSEGFAIWHFTTVSSFSPAYRNYLSTVAITGAGLLGATGVQFNGTSVPFTVNSNTSITATVPNGATAGPITVAGTCGSAKSAQFFYPCAPDPSLVGWWTGDGDAADITGGHNGTLQDGVTFGTGRVGQAFSLNGAFPSGAYVSVPHDPAFNFSNALTLEAWVKPTDGASRYIMTKGEDSFFLAVGGDYAAGNQLSFYLNNVSGGWLYGSSDLVTDGNWHHVAATYDGATINLYVDGRLESSFPRSGIIPTGTSPVAIGARPGVNFFGGLLDEVAVYNRALSPEEIKATSDAAPSGNCGAGSWVSAVAEVPRPGAGISLGPIYPNPFNPIVSIRFGLEIAGRAEVQIFDTSGRKVRTLFDDKSDAGYRTIRWNGTDEKGRSVASGIYYCRLGAAGGRITRRLVLVR
jgi:hypothetical protein